MPTSRHSISSRLGPFDEGRMHLTDREEEYAKTIKAAASLCPELDPLSDFMYAQYAIVTLVTETGNVSVDCGRSVRTHEGASGVPQRTQFPRQVFLRL
jgi:hypothetical protein